MRSLDVKNRRDSSEDPIFVRSSSSDEDSFGDREFEPLSKPYIETASFQPTIPVRNLSKDEPIASGDPPSAEHATEQYTEQYTGFFRGLHGRQKSVSAGPISPISNALSPQDITLRLSPKDCHYGLREEQIRSENSASVNVEHYEPAMKTSIMPKVDAVVIGTFSNSILARLKKNPDAKGGSNSYPRGTAPNDYWKATVTSEPRNSPTTATS